MTISQSARDAALDTLGCARDHDMDGVAALIQTAIDAELAKAREEDKKWIEELEKQVSKPKKIAPVQGYAAGIPWSMHLRAYDVYCKKYGAQPAMIDLEGRGCRGGFGTGELDMWIPGWRDELNELNTLRAENAQLKDDRDRLTAELLRYSNQEVDFQKQIAALKEDGELLDWLEAHKEQLFCVGWDRLDKWKISEEPENSLTGAAILGKGPTLRAAIRAAKGGTKFAFDSEEDANEAAAERGWP